MRNNSFYGLIFLILCCSSCSTYTVTQEDQLDRVFGTLSEEQKIVSGNTVQVKEKFRKMVLDGGNKPSDKNVALLLYAVSRQTDQVLEQLDRVLSEKDIEEKELVQLEDSIKALEKVILEMTKQNSFMKEMEVPVGIRMEYFPALKERKDLDEAQGKLYLLALKNKLLVWKMNSMRLFYEQVGASSGCGYSLIYPMVESESEIVEEGAMYKAKLFWATPTYLKGKLALDEIPVTASPLNDSFRFFFKASLERGEEKGLCKKQWKARYTYLNRNTGEDTTILITRDYFVKKPCK